MSAKVLAALDAVDAALDELSNEELAALMKTEEKAMIEAIVNDKPNIGLSLWVMSDPVGASAYISKVKAGEIA